MKYSLRQLLYVTLVIALVCSLAMYLTTSYRERLAIRAELKGLGIDGVGFGPRNAVRSIWARRPIDEKLVKKYQRLQIADLKESTSASESLAILSKMDGVNMLILSLSDVSDAEIASLGEVRGLKHLWISNTQVTDACIDQLAEIPELETIKLDGSKITSQGIERLRTMKPQLRIQ